MTFAVIIDCGDFDLPIYDSVTKLASEHYRDQIQPICNHPLRVLPEEEIRGLKRDFTQEDILVSVHVEKGKI